MRSSVFHLVASCCAAALASSTTAAQERPADPAASSLIEAVVHSTIRPPNQDIYLYERLGEAPRRLTDHPALDYNAAFSPDGRWLVFTSERAGGGDLYALDLGGNGALVQLTRHRAFDDAATFSPDGAQLAFVSTRDGDADIFLMPFAPEDPAVAEAAARNLTRRPGGDLSPAFSPDGLRIAFSRQDVLWSPSDLAAGPPTDFSNTHTYVYVMDADGSEPTRLTEPGMVTGTPTWSENGEFIYYYHIEDPGFFEGGAGRGEGLEIRRRAADGTDDVALAAFGLSPAVMPNGRIAFFRPRQAPDPSAALRIGDVVSVASDGSDLRVESDPAKPCFAPAFDAASGRMACHVTSPVDSLPRLRIGSVEVTFAPPGAQRRVELSDRRLAVHGVYGQFPAVLPSGDIVWSLFGSAAGAQPAALLVSRIDGADQRPLFAPPLTTVWAPAVARDAGWIFVTVGPPLAAEPSAPVDIWKLRIDGSEARNLTSDSPGHDAVASASADGRRVVFRHAADALSREIHVMDGDGGHRRALDIGPGFATMPAISPDGEWVVYPTTRTGHGLKLWIQRLDGGEGRLLEHERAAIPDISMHPRFSPDGRWVVFTSDRGHMSDEWPLTAVPQPYGDLWAVPLAGGPAVRLTDDKWEDGPNDWGFVRPVE